MIISLISFPHEIYKYIYDLYLGFNSSVGVYVVINRSTFDEHFFVKTILICIYFFINIWLSNCSSLLFRFRIRMTEKSCGICKSIIYNRLIFECPPTNGYWEWSRTSLTENSHTHIPTYNSSTLYSQENARNSRLNSSTLRC